VDSLLHAAPSSSKWFAPTDSESRGRGLLYKAGRQAGIKEFSYCLIEHKNGQNK
jgi:hypothetical protein